MWRRQPFCAARQTGAVPVAPLIVLAPSVTHFYVALMNFAAACRTLFLLFALLAFCPAARAQTIQVDQEEFPRLQGEVANLQDQNQAQRKRISELTRAVEQLQQDLRDADERNTIKMGDFVTREDLKKIMDRIAEVDEKRENDRKVILEEFEKLGQKLVQAPTSRNGNGRREREPENDAPPVKPWVGNVYPYKVKEGQTLSHIREDFNDFLRKEGRPTINSSDILRANPGLNPNRIYVGQELLLPVPEKK